MSKKPRVGRGRAVFQHVQPPGVVGAHDAHVVGNDVENLAHAVRLSVAQKRS